MSIAITHPTGCRAHQRPRVCTCGLDALEADAARYRWIKECLAQGYMIQLQPVGNKIAMHVNPPAETEMEWNVAPPSFGALDVIIDRQTRQTGEGT